MKTFLITLLLVIAASSLKAQVGIGTTSPNSTLDVRGSFSTPITTFTGATTAGASDNMLVFTGSSATTLTLPTAASIAGRIYWIKNGGTATVTIATTSSQTIDALSTWSLTQGKTLRVVSDGSNWYVAAETYPGSTTTSAWVYDGNAVGSVRNLGTTSNYALPFITNNTERMRITATGTVGIGTLTFNGTYPEKFLVDAGSTGNTNYQNVIVGKGNTNSYAQLNIQNNSTGTAASSDVVATSDNGNETTNFVDLGINGGGNTSTGVLGGANTAYLYSTGNDFAIGNGTASKNLIFFTNNAGTNTEQMRINSTGFVGIGTNSPNSMLDIRGSLSIPISTFSANTTAGASDNMLVFTGSSATTLTLPTAVSITGRVYWVKNGGTATLTVATTSSQTIDALSSWSLTQGKTLRVVSSGSNWYVAAETYPGSTTTSAWVYDGNTVGSERTLGTTSNYALPFITNNTERMRITATGSLGIGTSTFNSTYPERLIADAGSTGNTNYQNVIVGKGNTNSYAQLNIQNSNTGTAASSDVVATSNNGTESVNYIDMGINGGGNTSTGALGGANTAYLYSTGNDFSIGNATAGKSLILFTAGTASSNERMRIDSNGNVGIGTTSPYSKLEVNGSVAFPITNTTNDITLDATNYTVLLSSGTPTVTLPAASSSNAGRIYIIVNQTNTARTITSYRIFSGGSATTIAANSSITIQSYSFNWYRIQ
jgi:hypothetical protein